MYNKIRNFSIREGKRKNRLVDKEDRAVAEQVGGHLELSIEGLDQ